MPISNLTPDDLRFMIDPATLGFADTTELLREPLPWIGQERAETAARFGLRMEQADYNLFVLGEVGSGRSSLLHQEMLSVAAGRAVPPDLCYLHNFDAPERPRALRMPAGQGRQLRQLMAALNRTLQAEVPKRLEGQEFKTSSEQLEKAHAAQEAAAFSELAAFGEARSFALRREDGHLVFTLRGENGQALTEKEAAELPRERRAEFDRAEQELHAEINRFLDKSGAKERVLNEALHGAAPAGGQADAGARAAGDSRRPEEADQGCRQAGRVPGPGPGRRAGKHRAVRGVRARR